MKVGDWVIVTPDEFDEVQRGITEPQIGRITLIEVAKMNTYAYVKILGIPVPFSPESTGGGNYLFKDSQCTVVVEAPDVSQSDPA